MQKRRNRVSRKYYFLAAEMICYITFLSIDLGMMCNFFSKSYAMASELVKYLSVLLCVLYSWLGCQSLNKNDINLVRWALMFTAIADIFLLFTKWSLPGVLSFIVVQIIYAYRLLGKRKLNYILLAMIDVLLLLILNLMGIEVNDLLVVASVYGILLLHNVIYAWISYPGLSFKLGLFLLMLCDINVALQNSMPYLSSVASLNERLLVLSHFAIWLFYLPSQVFMVLSIQDVIIA